MSAYSNSTYASEPNDDWVDPDPAILGTCNLCGQDLILTEDDCWHPHYVELACPVEPDTADGWDKFYLSGSRPGRPGRQHFRPLE